MSAAESAGADDSASRRAEALRLWEDSRLAFKRRDYRRAAKDLQALLDRCGEDFGPVAPVDLRLTLGVALLRNGETQRGLPHLERAVQLAPQLARAHQKLGAALGRLGRDEEALPLFQRAVELAPENAEYQWRLGEQHRRLGDAQSAERCFRRSLELDPEFADSAKGLEALGVDRRPSWVTRIFGR